MMKTLWLVLKKRRQPPWHHDTVIAFSPHLSISLALSLSLLHIHSKLLVASRGRKTHRPDRCGSVCGESTSLSREPRWWKQTEQYPRELMRTENNLPSYRNGSEEKNTGARVFSFLCRIFSFAAFHACRVNRSLFNEERIMAIWTREPISIWE